eukprot:353575-Chlamydomonas_euryale.AAC.1
MSQANRAILPLSFSLFLAPLPLTSPPVLQVEEAVRMSQGNRAGAAVLLSTAADRTSSANGGAASGGAPYRARRMPASAGGATGTSAFVRHGSGSVDDDALLIQKRPESRVRALHRRGRSEGGAPPSDLSAASEGIEFGRGPSGRQARRGSDGNGAIEPTLLSPTAQVVARSMQLRRDFVEAGEGLTRQVSTTRARRRVSTTRALRRVPTGVREWMPYGIDARPIRGLRVDASRGLTAAS